MTQETSYWIGARRINKQACAPEWYFPPVWQTSDRLIRATVSDYARLIPSSAVLGMVLLASVCICATVIARTRTELKRSLSEYQEISSAVNTARRVNAMLRLDLDRAQSDPRMIEAIARGRLGMVRPADVVVPAESTEKVSQVNTLIR